MNIGLLFDIVLIVVILAAFVVSLIGLIRVVQEGFLKRWNIYVGISFGLLFVSYLIYNVISHKIEPTGWAQIFLTLGLIMATGLYALVAFRMAEEMRKQRYDALHPIIDIVNIPQTPLELAKQAYAKEFPKELDCILYNVGVGTATDVYSFVYLPSGERQRHNFDTLPIGKGTSPMMLSLAQKDDHWFLVAYYKDVYGRWFESSREVRVGAVNPDPLQIREIPEEELPK